MKQELGAIAAMTLALLATCGEARAEAAESGVGAADGATTAAATAEAGEGFEAFAGILRRNIFDPERQPARPAAEATPAPVATPEPRVDTVNLVGTWITENQRMAFLESPNGALAGIRQEGEAVGDWTIAMIATDRVTLAQGEKKVEWGVGQGLRRSEGEAWQLTERTAAAAPATASSATTGTAATAGGGEQSEVLRRLMERRQRETRR